VQAVSAGVARDPGRTQLVRYLARVAAVAIVYWAVARLSLNLALVHGQVTPIWPPTGIALVTFLLLGRRMWPAIALAAFAVNLPLGPSPVGAGLIACGNTLAPLVSSELLRRADFHPELDRMRDAVAIVLLGALVGMTVSATIGSSVLTLSGAVSLNNFASTWAVWWAGDAMGVLLVAPMLLSLVPRPGLRPLGWRRSVELTVLLAGVGVVTYFLFENRFRLEYLVLPLIAVAAWRFRLAGAAPAALIASVIAAWAAVNDAGPFASETLLEKMVTLQAFNVSLSLASFLLASFADARQQAEELARLYNSASLAIAAKTDAIDVAGHELGPPVAALTSYLAILSEGKLGPPPPRWRATLNVMADKAWQVDRIMNELVEAARIEAKTDSTNHAYVDLREAVNNAVDRARGRAEMSGAQIGVSLAKEPVPVHADSRQIGRILDNLINNSLTYVARPPRLKLEAAVDRNRGVVRVIDNGVGMSASERARVFQPFHRTNDPAFSSVPGVGLGLYASRILAEANQGRLTLEATEPGVGTRFALDLPLTKLKPPGETRIESAR
jgi:signal transduction histidine kinase